MSKRTGLEGLDESTTARERDELFRRLIEDIREYAIYTLDPEGYVTSWNLGAERIKGWTTEEVIGQHCRMFFGEDDRRSGKVELELAVAAQNGRSEDEYWSIRKDGARFYAHVFITALHDEHGKLRGFTKVVRDVTERRESEERYRNLFEYANDIVYTQDLEGNFTSLNRAGEVITGYTRDEAMGMNMAVLLSPEDLELARQRIALKLNDGAPTRYELVIITKRGQKVRLEVNTRLIYREGKPVGVMGIARDITERKRAEDAQRFLADASSLVASSLEYETTLASVARMAVPVIADWCTVDVLDEDGAIKRLAVVHVDPSKVEWAHDLQRRYPPDANAEVGIPNVLRTGKSELYPEIPDAMLMAAAVDAEHLRIMREIGFTSAMIVPLVAHARTLGAMTFISAESGRHYGADDLALAENLAGRAALAVDNARLYRAARQANRLKDEFLATLSHELRTPLTSIIGWAHLLRTGQLDEVSFAGALETIQRNARAQAQLVDDLLDVSRIITGKLRLNVRQVDPHDLIDAAIEAVRPAANAKSVRLQKVMDTGSVRVAGDAARLQQVVWNLLSNAIKFTPKDGRVQVRLEHVDSNIEIAVSDTGAGISPEFLPNVFDRFRQADQTTTRRHGGLGLGLAIVRHIVELHGGTAQAESGGPGQGATFTVRLPVVAVYHKESSAGESVNHVTGEDLLESDCPEKLDGLRILVVDDEADTRALLKVALERCGAEVTVAGSSEEALAALKVMRPQLLISDVGMPVEDGYELIRKVRALPAEQGGKVPAVALTAYARAEDRLRALRSGYQMHVAKPVELTELIAVVGSLVRRED
jgi:PAS domain S-box-containing protein